MIMINEEKKFIGSKIKLFRKRQKLTQAELAEQIGISEKHISKIEAGVYTPTLLNFIKILKILNIGLDEFGFNVNTNTLPARDELITLIYEASDEEITFFLNTIKNFNSLSKKQ